MKWFTQYSIVLIFVILNSLYGFGGDEVKCIDFSYYVTDSVLTEGTIDTIEIVFSIPEGLLASPQPQISSYGILDTAYFSDYLTDRKYLIISAKIPF